MTTTSNNGLQSTGIVGLDDVLHGGLSPGGLYTVEGDTGAGKTTLGLQFLMAGASRGERVLFVTLSESEADLRAMAASHGWNLDGVAILEVVAADESLTADQRYTMFHPSEVELTETTRVILERAAELNPSRLVIDSVGELRLLAQTPLRYRRQILAVKHFFTRQQCTLVVIDDPRAEDPETAISSIAAGIITLEREATEYGGFRRRLQVMKMRGRLVREGFHDCRIERGGLVVFPRLVAAEHRTSYARENIPSGLAPLDTLLGGGLARGTSTLIMGPAGTGKSSLANQYARAALARGHPVAFFLFDESIATFAERSAGLGFDVAPMIESGTLIVRQVDPAELSPGEFAHVVQQCVEEKGARIVIIDSLNGYLQSMPSERLLTLHLHELLNYLGLKGVTTIMLMAQHGLLESFEVPVDTSYLADAVVLLRFYEAAGRVRTAISVMKKRTGRHERTIRDMTLSDGGITIGEPIEHFQGVLTGTPHLIRSGPAA